MRGVLVVILLSLVVSACGNSGTSGGASGNNSGLLGMLRETFKF